MDFKSAQDVKLKHKELGYPEHFCVAPFTTMLFEPDGKVGACRQKGSEYAVGNIFEQKFEDIWNGEKLQKWRKQFLNGNPTNCSRDIKDKSCNLCPEYNSLLKSIEASEIQVKKPLKIGFNFNGHCNLECNMCHIWQKPNGLYADLGLWEKLDEWIVDLQDVELLSGEPFIQKDTYKLIDLISLKKPKAQWTITTNANWTLNDYIRQKLDQIQIKNIIISLDCVTAEFYKKIRKKGDFEKAISTLRQLKKYEKSRIEQGRSPLSIKINFLFQRENWTDLALIEKFSEAEQVDVFRTFLYEPKELSILTLDESEKIKILDWYFNNLNSLDLKKSMRVIRPILDSLEHFNKAYMYDILLNKINKEKIIDHV